MRRDTLYIIIIYVVQVGRVAAAANPFVVVVVVVAIGVFLGVLEFKVACHPIYPTRRQTHKRANGRGRGW